MLDKAPNDLISTKNQLDKLVADLDRDFTFIPEKERLAVYLAGWLIGQLARDEYIIGMELMLHAAENWLAQKKAGLS